VLYQEGAMPRKDFDQSAVALIQAKAQYDIAQKHMAALETVGKKDQLKSAKGQLTSAQGKYEGAATQLAYSEIRSPIDGVVTDRPVYPGETPPAGTPMLIIMDTTSVIARTHIPQQEAAVLKPGATATLTASGQALAAGKVTLISPALDPNSTTVEVWIEAPNPEGRLRPGTNVKIEIVARTLKDAIVVPAPALLKTPDGANAVMIVKDNRAHQVTVEPGVREGDKLQITQGIAEGDTVIVSGGYGLPDNTQVKIEEASKAEKPGAAAQPASEKD
jgi:RND family efflux transporter MFP subunit